MGVEKECGRWVFPKEMFDAIEIAVNDGLSGDQVTDVVRLVIETVRVQPRFADPEDLMSRVRELASIFERRRSCLQSRQ